MSDDDVGAEDVGAEDVGADDVGADDVGADDVGADGVTDDESGDDLLMASLRAAGLRHDPVPPLVDAAAREAFTWRTVDAELAALELDTAGADGLVGVRSSSAGPRVLSFVAGDGSDDELVVDVQVQGAPGSWSLLGQVAPAADATVEVRTPPVVVEVVTDGLGRFRVEDLPGGPLSLRVTLPGGRVVVTDWQSL